jgi:uncharacterized membrane protein YcaP (DUF421 family)
MAAVFRAMFGYLFLVFMVRVVGRRPGKQMTPFDYVLVFFMGGLTLTPMVGNDRSLVNAATIVLTIALTHFGLAWLRHWSPRIGRIVDGVPIVLIERGKVLPPRLDGMVVQEADIMAAARDRGVEHLDEIEYAVLERNGEISIIAYGS